MSGRKKPPEKRRTRLIKVWVTPAEWQHVADVAGALEVSLSAYGRHRLLTGLLHDRGVRAPEDVEAVLHERLGYEIERMQRDLRARHAQRQVLRLLDQDHEHDEAHEQE